ncbi:MAG: hypothetical protein ABIH34_03525 [Nanoarchaeota archaeon]
MPSITQRKKFAHGKRGIIYTGMYKGKKVAIKKKRMESLARDRMQNEATWLRILNRHGIGPKFLSFKNNEVVYEFVEGEFIVPFLEKVSLKRRKDVILDVFLQMYALDLLGVNKEEMHHPLKHILVTKGDKPVLIDFERCHLTEKPKNVTQFLQFVTRTRARTFLGVMPSATLKKMQITYKSKYSEQSFRKLLVLLHLLP